MAKKIKVVVTAMLELPDSAEVIRFRDEESVESDHIKFGGLIIRPDIGWMQYISSAVSKKKYKHRPFANISWESIPEDMYNEFFADFPEEWYLEELS